MLGHVLVWCFVICLSKIHTGVAWSLQITPESSHIRVNQSTVIRCNLDDPITDCKFKIDNRATLMFHKGTQTLPIVVKENGRVLYTARYAGAGVFNGDCGLGLSNVAKGFYVIGCHLRDFYGRVRQEFMTLLVDDSRPLKLKVNMKYQSVKPGSDLEILCSPKDRRKLDHCGFRLSSNVWINLNKGHRSLETPHYHYHGRGLDKGDCGVKLLNVTEADNGVVWCHTEVGARRGVRAVIVKVGNLQPTTEILWEQGRTAVPGETLQMECIMKGAYPLPPMIWHYGDKELQCSDSDKTRWKDSTFRWMWEDQVMRQHIIHYVGHSPGKQILQCNAAYSESACVAKEYRRRTYVEFHVKPACGLRTTTYYNTAYQSKITKRDTGSILYDKSKGGHLDNGDDVKFTDSKIGDDHSYNKDTNVKRHLISSSPQEADAFHADDLGDSMWDEVDNAMLENVPAQKEQINFEEFDFYGDLSPGFPAGGGFEPVIDISDGTVLNGSNPNVEFVSYPWMAGVYKNIKGRFEQQCGGTLVSETHVISAAHCFWSHQRLVPLPPNDYMIALGKIYRDWERADEMVQRRGVRQLLLHPSWRGHKRNLQFDIAVLELSERVTYTPRVAPACLDWDDYLNNLKDTSGVVSGWGYTEDGQPSKTLRFSNLPYVDPDTCFDHLHVDLQGLLSTDKFCAGFTDRNISVCPGDSGGGILFRDHDNPSYYLKGVVSLSFKPAHFKGQCYLAEVTGFTTVAQAMPWLKKVLNFDFQAGKSPDSYKLWEGLH